MLRNESTKQTLTLHLGIFLKLSNPSAATHLSNGDDDGSLLVGLMAHTPKSPNNVQFSHSAAPNTAHTVLAASRIKIRKPVPIIVRGWALLLSKLSHINIGIRDNLH